MRKLFEELETIRMDKNFIDYGFGSKGGHLSFIDLLKRHSKSKNRQTSEQAKTLVMIAFGYAANRGMKTDRTDKLCEHFLTL
jgi:hypothetical protein